MFLFNVWKQTAPVELRNRKNREIDVGASHWQLCIVLLDSRDYGNDWQIATRIRILPPK